MSLPTVCHSVATQWAINRAAPPALSNGHSFFGRMARFDAYELARTTEVWVSIEKQYEPGAARRRAIDFWYNLGFNATTGTTEERQPGTDVLPMCYSAFIFSALEKR